MKPDEVRRLYDASYAASYEEKFLQTAATAPDAQHERLLIDSFLSPDSRWLDVACGTGYFLSQFPAIERTGLDLSPAMIARARAKNPGIEILEHDFRVPIPEWRDRFDLVSCMWYAYTLVDSMDDIGALIDNLAAWTAPSGRCFLPAGDPSMIAGVDIPYVKDSPALANDTLLITGITWSFVEDGGAKVHRHLLTPQIDVLVERFSQHFEQVDVIRYPPVNEVSCRPAIVASRKRHV